MIRDSGYSLPLVEPAGDDYQDADRLWFNPATGRHESSAPGRDSNNPSQNSSASADKPRFLDTDLTKKYLRLDQDYEDELVEEQIIGAEEAAEQFINRFIYADSDERGDDDAGVIVNANIREAIRRIVGTRFAIREDIAIGISTSEIPQTAQDFLWPYRRHIGV